MSKPNSTSEISQDKDAFEMIELAIGDLDTLTRAFQLIEEVCEGKEAPTIFIDDVPALSKLH